MKILAIVVPWTILLLAAAVSITSWVWMNNLAQTHANSTFYAYSAS